MDPVHRPPQEENFNCHVDPEAQSSRPPAPPQARMHDLSEGLPKRVIVREDRGTKEKGRVLLKPGWNVWDGQEHRHRTLSRGTETNSKGTVSDSPRDLLL